MSAETYRGTRRGRGSARNCDGDQKRILASHYGLTLIELVVVIAIIGILAGLLMPAIGAAREASRSTECSNHLRQIGIAIQNHESRHRYFPGNGGYDQNSKIRNPSGREVTISTTDYDAGITLLWGIGRPGASPREQPGSWAFAILPDLEQGNAYYSLQVGFAGSEFRCPSRSRGSLVTPQNDQYGEYEAAGKAWRKTDYAANRSVALNLPDATKASSVTDGLSNTIAVGEKAFDPSVQTDASWYWDEPVFSGGSHGTARDGLLIEDDGYEIRYKNNWGSAHPSLATFSMLDGSVHRISNSIDWRVLRSSLTPRKNEIESIVNSH